MEPKDSSEHKDEERVAWLALKLIADLGNRSILRLINRFGSPGEVLRAGVKDLAGIPGLREKAQAALLAKKTVRSPEAEWERLQREGIKLVCIHDADYPPNLAAIPDPPAVLFVLGSLESRDLVSVAVVGSRAASPMGMAFTEQLATDLAQSGVTVVSGFALGIDSAAHQGALKGKGRTLAILGCGLDIEYPRTNSVLRRQIPDSGAMMSEFPLETPPAPGHFPLRNRIISGLALGVVVVEAAERSGSLITARLALEQGREVFAVPGMARHFRSIGPHRLLKQGAKLVECAEDILEEIRPLVRPSWTPNTRKAHVPAPVPDVTADEAALLEALPGSPVQIDEICRSIQWPVSRVMAVLLALELKGVVRQLPGKYFVSLSDGSC